MNPLSVPRGVSRPSGSVGPAGCADADGFVEGSSDDTCPDAKPALAKQTTVSTNVRAPAVRYDFVETFNTFVSSEQPECSREAPRIVPTRHPINILQGVGINVEVIRPLRRGIRHIRAGTKVLAVLPKQKLTPNSRYDMPDHHVPKSYVRECQ